MLQLLLHELAGVTVPLQVWLVMASYISRYDVIAGMWHQHQLT